VEASGGEDTGPPTHLLAGGLGGALSFPAAVRSPRLFKRLVLVCPTGYEVLGSPSGLLGDVIYRLSLAPVLGDTLYHAVVSRRGIRYYLERVAYHRPDSVTRELVNHYHRTGHQRGARYFPAAFLAGKLNLGVAGYWPRVPHRTLICWGREAKVPPSHQAHDFVRRNPRAEPRIFKDAALLPHDERAETFNREVRRFLLKSGART